MRLLIVLPSLCAEGTPVLALQLCRHWLAEGHQLRLLVLQSEPNDLRAEFVQLGVPIHTLHLGRGLARYPRLLAASWQLCRRWHPDGMLSMPLGWHAFIAWGARLAGVRHCCAHVGNLPPVWTGTAFAKFKAQVQLGRPVTQKLLCCSNYVRDATIRDFGVSPREAITVYNACDLDAFRALPRPAIAPQFQQPPRAPRVVMVARLELHKDQPTLIHAAALLRQRGVAVVVELVGEGSHRPQLEQLINDLGLQAEVQLLGMRRDIPTLLAAADLFVFAAKPDEGFGIALAEAMASGIPIIATDVGACREVLDGGSCGLLVPPADPAALASAIQAVLGDLKAALRRAAEGQKRAQELFSVPRMADAYLQALGTTSSWAANSQQIVRARKLTLVEILRRKTYALSRDPIWLVKLRYAVGKLIATGHEIRFKLMPASQNRYLICIPRGGLNDVLCQVQYCMYYAIKTRRQLLVNTCDSTIGKLEDVFDTKSLPALKTFDQLPEQIKSLKAWPPIDINILLNRSCDLGWDPTISGYLTFDHNQHYKEPLLVHSGRGGGFGLDLLCRLKLTDQIRYRVQQRLSILPQGYDAIQVRNSDIKTDFDAYLEQSDLEASSIPLLLCTDDESIVTRAEKKLRGVRKTLLLRPLRNDSSSPLHYDKSISQLDRNTDLFSDLIGMAMARKLHIVPQTDGSISGFPRLAKALHAHPRVAASLLTGESIARIAKHHSSYP